MLELDKKIDECDKRVMSLSEFATRFSLVPTSMEVNACRKNFESRPNRSPIPYKEFSVSDLLNRAYFGLKTGDLVETFALTTCVIKEIQSDGTMIVHSVYWDHVHSAWLSAGTQIKLQDITAFLGYQLDVEKAKRLVVDQPDY